MISWGLSAGEGHCHAIDELAEHPAGALRAQCGQLLPSRTTLYESLGGTVCEECARRQIAAALHTVTSTHAPRPPVEHCPPAAPGGRGAPRSPLRSRMTALIRAVVDRAVTSLSLPDRGPRAAPRRQVPSTTRLAAGLHPSPRAPRGQSARAPEVIPTMPPHPPRPRRGDDAEPGVALRDIPLLDADGVEIPLLGARVEQIAVNEAHGASPSRLHQHGDVIGRAAHLVYVRFEGEFHHSALRPHLVRLLPAPDTTGSPGQRA